MYKTIYIYIEGVVKDHLYFIKGQILSMLNTKLPLNSTRSGFHQKYHTQLDLEVTTLVSPHIKYIYKLLFVMEAMKSLLLIYARIGIPLFPIILPADGVHNCDSHPCQFCNTPQLLCTIRSLINNIY